MGMMKCIEDGWEAELFSTKKSWTRHYNVCIFLSLNTPFLELYFVYFTVYIVCEEIIKFVTIAGTSTNQPPIGR